MTRGIQIKVWGDYALFSRPEFKTERASYEVLTPSAARGILDAVHWKPAIRWVIDRIHVRRPIRFETIRRNEVAGKAPYTLARQAARGEKPMPYLVVEDDRQQRAALVLRDVEYVIEAHFDMTERAGPGDNPAKHLEMARRRIERGQCAWQPSLGTREFTAFFGPVEPGELETVPDALRGERDLGWMLHDIDFADGMTPHFFHAVLRDGVLDVPPFTPRGRAAS
ncbi:type I-C CRISPR-associated protein Cas5c [Caenispirillum bisanense]|uniref:type I-C CRISPR-associated protein Cas5c n=1 Tax=Caenispirillum bisanense TaxID=414052 RepID=UPI0031CE1B87